MAPKHAKRAISPSDNDDNPEPAKKAKNSPGQTATASTGKDDPQAEPSSLRRIDDDVRLKAMVR
jgi:hypothetical protein